VTPRRSRCQRRLRRKGYTWEVTTLRPLWPSQRHPKLIVIHKPGGWGWRSYRDYLLDDEVIRPVGTYYIHNGKKPR
jgi:hypothetical protein